MLQHDCQEFLALLLDALHQQLIALPKDVIDMDTFDVKVSAYLRATSYSIRARFLMYSFRLAGEYGNRYGFSAFSEQREHA